MSNWTALADCPIKAGKETFGCEVEYVCKGGSPTATFDCISFDSAFDVVDVEGDVEVSTTAPVIDIRLADLPQDPQLEDRVTIETVEYAVEEMQPGGHCSMKLRLSETGV